MQKNNVILPPKMIGIIGGGQLGRMMAIAARHMGYTIAVLDPTPNCPTAQVADEHIVAAYDDMEAIKKLTEISDVVTYEFENVDLTAAKYIEAKGKLPQGAHVLEVTQNREKEKQQMKEAGLPVPDFSIVTNGEECKTALENTTFPAVIKTCRGGYDGKGQLKLTGKSEEQEAIEFTEKHQHCIIEQWVPFDKEISVVFTRTQNGGLEIFPIAENTHKDHILYQTEAPASISEQVRIKAVEAATILAEKMQIVGTFAIEMFVKGDEIYLNEMAPRPHNSGHYTIEACNISQFGQHIRAICGLPLTPVRQLQKAAMVNILGDDMEHALTKMPVLEKGSFHLYGKAGVKPKRKMGHVTFTASKDEEVSDLVNAYRRKNND
ncbi:5-(carboxyamino)imidazole ribonucleotide synthase [Virgibacillus dakarensis]|uniref:N5-carboxyaminoimidazole ribonucleotide synthase n=1 Tax=Lentibacillus populi TaxID=1827502 RepID=A0A9W5TZ69_9BACI|nr:MULTISPECIES: 5-(carboxyamino)imidazole ribonucleotide synthase [Bacillaceae]MBT2217442.1 5-(carboxyamino)imidazole ribonucleotide synthase [Virgibacillus dakarensis]MTW86276.1 5-(carboxyamino)imidazole ribonucleotide synthase [Virgibacillus dakarensis]GGB50187.1 N5-carboxyaminoimidazole ribonucleotide synthase [Lentibacillus populi]